MGESESGLEDFLADSDLDSTTTQILVEDTSAAQLTPIASRKTDGILKRLQTNLTSSVRSGKRVKFNDNVKVLLYTLPSQLAAVDVIADISVVHEQIKPIERKIPDDLSEVYLNNCFDTFNEIHVSQRDSIQHIFPLLIDCKKPIDSVVYSISRGL
ncbi:unnamed protein product, partial [Didymodactylos carnosus]